MAHAVPKTSPHGQPQALASSSSGHDVFVRNTSAGRGQNEAAASARASPPPPAQDDATYSKSHHRPTPPIAVPFHEENSTHIRDAGPIAYPHSPRYPEPSPLEQFARNRQPSISFNPQARLDTGAYHAIDLPLRSRSRSGELDADIGCAASEPPSLYVRTCLDNRQHAAWRQFEPGDGYDEYSDEDLNASRSAGPENTLSSPLGDVPDLQRPTSLTSLSTASPLTEEVLTPPRARRDSFRSAYSLSPAVTQSISLESTEAWFSAGRAAKSRTGSVRQLQNHSSRRSTMSGGKSPASAFLAMWNRDDVVPEPDDEGQVVGNDYVLGKQIGFGGFSVVKEAYKVKDDGKTERFAVKIVRKHLTGKSERENDQVQAEFDHEVRVWRYLSHPHILPLDAVYVTDHATFCFTRLTTGGTLLELVRRQRGGLKIQDARCYAQQLAQAIRYLHEDARVVHRDIKLENCLLDPAKHPGEVSQLVLCDFGMAEWLVTENGGTSPDPYDDAADRPPPKNIGPSDTSTSRAGSLEYASPELLSCSEGILNPVVDIWAFGVVLFALLVGARPFQHSFQPRVRVDILAGHWDRHAVLKGDGDPQDRQDALELIQGCLEMDRTKRWTIADVLSSRWFSHNTNSAENNTPQ